MGHEIDNTAGRYSFADSRNDAWHQLGQQVGHEMTPAEALEAANMNGWDVRKIEHAQTVPDGLGGTVEVNAPGQWTVLRTNPVTLMPEALAVVGDRWQPIQNEETTDLLYAITDQSGAHIQTIGALDGGRRTFVTMLMPTHVEFTGSGGFRDTTEVYLAVINHHDGQGSLRAIISPVRIVCANTQRIAEQEAVSSVALRHVGAGATKLAEVRRLLGLTFKYTEVYAHGMEALQVDREEAWVRAVFNDVFGVNAADSEKARNARVERVTQVMEVMRHSPSITPFAGTAYAAYNAVTEYADHFMPVFGKGGNAATKRAVRTLTSADVHKIKSDAYAGLTKALPLTTDQVLRWGPMVGASA